MSAANRSAKRISALIIAALTDDSKDVPGRVDSVTRLSYLLGLDRSIKILMEEMKKEKDESIGKANLHDKALGQ